MTGSEEEELGPGAAYAAQVADWLKQAYQAQALQLGFYTFLAQQQPFSGATFPPPFLQPSQQPTTTAFTNQPQPGANVPNNQSQAGAAAAAQQQRPAPTINNLIVNGRSVPLVEQRLYTLPPIWKRIVAEILDIFILFTLKILITFTAVDMLDILELEGLEILNLSNQNLQNINIEDLDYNTALQFTTELLLLELVHRFVVCIFEAMCTHRGQRGMIGGATPGKVMMGLKIVKCDQVVPIGGMRVLVAPGNNLGIWWALLRSFIKNISLAIFFPLCISLLFLPNSRTLHDVISRSIVVENDQRLVRQQPR